MRGYAGLGARLGAGLGAGICGTRCETDHLPEITPAGLPFFGLTPPQSTKPQNGSGKRSANQKRNAYFSFNLLIINDISQYFNMHLHLISFIIYNR